MAEFEIIQSEISYSRGGVLAAGCRTPRSGKALDGARIEKKPEEIGIDWPMADDVRFGAIEVDTKRALVSVMKVGNVLYCSGSGPWAGPSRTCRGKVGNDYPTEQGYEAARWSAVGTPAQVKLIIADLDRVRRVVTVSGMVNATGDFEEQPEVVNGPSDLFIELFGEMSKRSRSAVGMGSLRGGQPVDLDAIFEIA